MDTLLHPRWIVTVDAQDRILGDHSLLIRKGRIADIQPTSALRGKLAGVKEMDLPQHALLPGLINAHTHAAMTLLRGLADDLPLMEWLNEHIWPAERRWVNADFVRDGTRHAVAEMVRGGITCFNDMYFFPDITGHTAAEAGMRAVVGLIVIDFPSAWAAGPDEYLEKGLKVHETFRGHHLIRTAFAPHAPYTVSDGPLSRIRTLSDELEIPVHIHVHETDDEIRDGLDRHNRRPMERLDGLGLLSPSLLGVHMTHLTDEEIERYADSGAHTVHCPESNLKLASGFCPVQRLLDIGVNVALGTDGASSNNDLDLFAEMRTAALLAKAVAGNAAALPAKQALRMATINGAKALGLDQELGSLETGKSADLIAVDLGGIETQPLYHPESQLVYAGGRDQVRHVWVAGKPLLHDGRLTTLDEAEVIAASGQWAERIAGTKTN